MSYRRLSKDIRKRISRDEVSDDGQGSAQESPADDDAGLKAAPVSSWDEEAQDQISALLDDVDDEEEAVVDLAALRKALAQQQQEEAEDTPIEDTPIEDTPIEDGPAEDAPVETITAQEDEPQVVEAASDADTSQDAPQTANDPPDEAVVRLDWLDKLLSSKRNQDPETAPLNASAPPMPKEDPGLTIDELLADRPSTNGSAHFEVQSDPLPAAESRQAVPDQPVREIVDLSDHNDFLELRWDDEPTDKGAANNTQDPTATPPTSSTVQWTSLADLEPSGMPTNGKAAADHEDPDKAPIGNGSGNEAVFDTAPGDDNATPEPVAASSFDGSPVDDTYTPVPDVADWTQQRAEAAAPADAPPADAASADAPPADAASADAPPADAASADAPPADAASAEVEPAAEAPAASDVAERDEPSPKVPDVDLEIITSRDRVVAMLLKKKIVEPDEVKIAYGQQQKDKSKEPVWRMLAIMSDTARHQIFEEAASVYAFRKVEFGAEKPDPEFARSVMDTFEEELRDGLLKLRVIPLAVDLDQQTGAIKVVFITHDPTRPEVHRMMQKLKLERFELRYAPENIVTSLMLEAFPRRNEFLDRLDDDNAYDLGSSYDSRNNELIDEDALEAEISRSKLINLFEATLVESVRLGASDIHIWPNADKHVEIHLRIDGRLQRWHLEDKIHPEALIAVIKDNSMNVDRFEREAAQDGFIQRWIDEALIRFRVSVLPIANAATDVRSESIVIRVLDDRKVIKDLRKLGLHELSYQRFRKAISQPHGMVILTGPTGSGKTTTLYASLHEVVTPEVNVLTVEDPVEYILPGVRQIKLNNKLGLEGALRSILRHDPDVVMVGEMRDKETAELAIKLANTGHLTFSTLHTNDAASAVTRLYKMEIEPFLIAYAINLVVAQRLIRRLCTQCKEVDPDPDPVLLKNLGFEPEEIASHTFYMEGEGKDECPKCKGLGFKGRRAITEALYFSREIRHLIADSGGKLDENDIKDMAVKQGMMTLQDSAREVVKAGDTSILEMLRVVATEE